jgi:hypothetical protein
MRTTAAAVALLAAVCAALPQQAAAWGLAGHTMLGQAAMAHLPGDLPDFVKAPAAKAEIVYLQDEEDRLKLGEDTEAAWAREWTTDHYLDIDDAGTVGGVVSIAALPATRDDFIEALERANPPVDPYDVGFLPYSILEGYEQVRTDFALYRHATGDDVAQREQLTLHDIGIFSHFVGDGSQPLHVSVHFNGWGKYPNPQSFTQSRDTHAAFESDFVDKFVTEADVSALVGQARVLSTVPLVEIEQYLQTTDSQVIPFYQMEKAGAFVLTDATSSEHQQGVKFAAQRLAAASEMLDSLILTAWETSASIKPYSGS